MKFEVMDRFDATKYANSSHDEKAIIISISSKFCKPPRMYPDRNGIHNGVEGIIFLSFNDEEVGFDAIQGHHAKRIIDFVDEMAPKVDKIIVHCDAGVSRSAGVCAAIQKYLGYDDFSIFDNPRYCPNMRCYRTVLEYGMQKKGDTE